MPSRLQIALDIETCPLPISTPAQHERLAAVIQYRERRGPETEIDRSLICATHGMLGWICSAASAERRATCTSESASHPTSRASRSPRIVRVRSASVTAATSAECARSGCHATISPVERSSSLYVSLAQN